MPVIGFLPNPTFGVLSCGKYTLTLEWEQNYSYSGFKLYILCELTSTNVFDSFETLLYNTVFLSVIPPCDILY